MRSLATLSSQININNKVVNKNANHELTKLFNGFFNSLKVIFPASIATIKTESEIKAFKKQWITAFSENGITSEKYVRAGMSIARRQQSPFLPSVGQFIAWCKQGLAEQYGLPIKHDLVSKLKDYCLMRGLNDFSNFDYGSNENYWLVNDLYRAMIDESLDNKRTEERAEELIANLTKKLMNGYIIPKPRLSLVEKATSKPLSKSKSLERIKQIKNKYGLGKTNTHA